MPNDIPTHGTISWGRRLTPAANAFGLALMLMLGFAQKAGAQSSSAASANGPLTFGNNFFVTGDYVVGGTYGLNTNFANDGTSKGTITIPDGNPGITGAKSVPAGAQIVAALLYWQTVEKISQTGSGQNGFFRPVFNGGPPTGYPITGVSLNSHSTVSFSFGGCTGTSTGKILQTYRADVRAALRQDANGNVLANGTYEVRLPSVGPSTPLTLGATLVLIYRVLAPNVPLNSIVIYDGAFAPTSTSLVMTQTVQGFYDAAESPVSRLTHIVGGGKNYKFQTVYLNNVPLPPMYATGQPFPGYYGGSTGYGWDNTTWTFGPNSNPVHDDDVSATTKVVPTGSNQGCVSWGAVIIGTTVQNSDNDGLLDVWKKIPPGYPNPGYCDAAVNEGVCTPGSSSWVDLPGAAPGQKDVFVQLDYMCRNVTGPNSCNAGNGIDPNGPYSFDPRSPVDPVDGKNALQKVIDAFTSSPNHAPVNLHVIPTYAIQEPTCTDTSATPAGLCAFPNQPGVVGWKGGLVFVKNQLVDSATGRLDTCTLTNPPATCVPVFQHGKKDSYHYALFAHALGLPNWTLQAGTLKSVAQFGNTVMFTTSVPVGMLGNAGYNGFDAQGNPIPKADPTCANGRVTVAFAATNSNLNGTHCILNATQPTDTSFTIVIGGNSITTNYTLLTDPNIAVASGEAGTVSGFSDVGGQDSLITLGLWGNPALSTSKDRKSV